MFIRTQGTVLCTRLDSSIAGSCDMWALPNNTTVFVCVFLDYIMIFPGIVQCRHLQVNGPQVGIYDSLGQVGIGLEFIISTFSVCVSVIAPLKFLTFIRELTSLSFFLQVHYVIFTFEIYLLLRNFWTRVLLFWHSCIHWLYV